MTLVFSLIVITTILVLGVKILTAEGMILEQLGKWGEEKMDEGVQWISPLFGCAWCMPSLYTFLGVGIAFGMGLIPEFSFRLIFYYPVVAFGSSLTSGLIWQYYLTKNAQKELYEEAKETASIFSDWLHEDLTVKMMEEHESTNN